jgi:hypothetical protein
VSVKDIANPAGIISAAIALLASLAAVVFADDIGTLLYLGGVVLVGTLALCLGILLRKGRQQRIVSFAVFAAFLCVTAGVVISQRTIRPHLLWLISSNRYKNEVLSNAVAANGELKHMEWDGDGWGSGVTGEWTGYIVFDPSDSLSPTTKEYAPKEYTGIPCKVILVRRLEKQWYSVVLDMNQFWDKTHPNCRSTYSPFSLIESSLHSLTFSTTTVHEY